jgi:hypothetical protein
MAEAGVEPVSFTFVGRVGRNLTSFKAHSERENFLLHEEVKALMKRFGISYKDAAHRLFMAEVERAKKADSAASMFGTVRTRIDDVFSHDICILA